MNNVFTMQIVMRTVWFDGRKVRTKRMGLMFVITLEGSLERVEVCSFGEPLDYLPSKKWLKQFEDQVLDLVCSISEHAPLTMRAAKVAIAALCEHKPSSATQDADRAVLSCFNSQDAAEGRNAFSEKRKPSFSGQ